MKDKIKWLILILLIPVLFGFIRSRFGPWWGLREQASAPGASSNGGKIFVNSSNVLCYLDESGSIITLSTTDPNISLSDPTTIGTLSLGSASITDTSGAISFGNENLTTTGTFSAEDIASTDDADITDNLTAGDMIIDEAAGVLDFTGATSATISSSGAGKVSFSDDNILTTGKIGIGSGATAPTYALDIIETGAQYARVYSSNGNVAGIALRTNTATGTIYTTGNNSKVIINGGQPTLYVASNTAGINEENPGSLGSLAVQQQSSTGAIPVLKLTQDDDDQVMIHFDGQSDVASVDRSLVDASDYTTPGSIVGWIQIQITDNDPNGPITDGDYYIPFYASPSS